MGDTQNLQSKFLAKLITTVANSELETDKIRFQISKCKDFNTKSALSYIDRHGLERISKENLKDYLADENLNCSNDEVVDLIHTYDSTQMGCLNYQDFSRMLEVKVQSFLVQGADSGEPSSTKGAKALLRDFFEHEIILLRRADPLFHELRFSDGYNPKGLFTLIARKGCQFFDYGDLDKFMRDHGILFSDAELVAIFRRADPRNLGVINFLEFKKYLLFHMSSLIETADDPFVEGNTSQGPPDLEDIINKYGAQRPEFVNLSRDTPYKSGKTKAVPEKYTQPLPRSDIERTIKLTSQQPNGFSDFPFGKEMRGTYFRDHFQHFESSKPSDFYYFKHYFPNSTFKHYSHSLREFPKLERDLHQPIRQFYPLPKIADVNTLKPLQATAPEYEYDEKIYNPIRPAHLAKTIERWKVNKLEDAEVINPSKILGKTDEFFRKRVADIPVLKPEYIP